MLREGVESKMNPYDLYAIETALKIREEHGGTVRAISMGPPQAKETLIEAYMMGVDDCALLSDKAFAGSDALATGYALSGLIRVIGGFDLIICGKQTTDGDTAQVGPEVAEFLGIPYACNVTRIALIRRGALRVTVDMADYVQVQEKKLPDSCIVNSRNSSS